MKLCHCVRKDSLPFICETIKKILITHNWLDEAEKQVRDHPNSKTMSDSAIKKMARQIFDEFADPILDRMSEEDITPATMYFFGNWDANWLAFFEFGQAIGIDYTPDVINKFNCYMDFANNSNVSYLMDTIAICSDKPSVLKFHGNHVVHSLDGPAIQWPDEFSLYVWNGTKIPPRFIDNRHKITPKQILSETNVEHRRIMKEIYAATHGPDKFLSDLKAKKVSEDVNHGFARVLYDVQGERFIHVINGSLEPDGQRREFILGADPNASNPHQAVASSYGIPVDKYTESVRT